MKNPIVTSGSITCAEPGCLMALVQAVGKGGPKFCWDHTPDLYDDKRAVDVEPRPLRGRVTAPATGDEGEGA